MTETLAPAPFRCATCGCRSYARVAERKSDDTFGPGPQVRCVECKSVVPWPPVDPDAAAVVVSTKLTTCAMQGSRTCHCAHSP